MDYSLLLAIHNLDEAQREKQQDGTLTPSGQMVDQEKPLGIHSCLVCNILNIQLSNKNDHFTVLEVEF